MGQREDTQKAAPRSRLFGDAERNRGGDEPRRSAGAVPDTILGSGLEFHGEIRGQGNLEIHGHLEGDVNLQGRFHVRPDGMFLGDVKAAEVIVEGRLRGNVEASERADLRPDSEVHAQIRTSRFTIGEGCHFEGQVHMPERSGKTDGSASPVPRVSSAGS